MTVAIAIAQALIGGIPKIIELIRKGRDPGSIKLSEVISTDALAVLKKAKQDATDFIENG